MSDLAGKEIPMLSEEESYKYLGVYVNLNLDWKKQIEIMEAKLIRQTNYLRHRAFNSRQTIEIINKVFIPSIMYRANVFDIPEKTLKKWDAITSSLVFRKMRMPTISGRKYLYGDYSTGGMRLFSIKELAVAARMTSVLSEGLNAADQEAREIARAHFKKHR